MALLLAFLVFLGSGVSAEEPIRDPNYGRKAYLKKGKYSDGDEALAATTYGTSLDSIQQHYNDNYRNYCDWTLFEHLVRMLESSTYRPLDVDLLTFLLKYGGPDERKGGFGGTATSSQERVMLRAAELLKAHKKKADDFEVGYRSIHHTRLSDYLKSATTPSLQVSSSDFFKRKFQVGTSEELYKKTRYGMGRWVPRSPFFAGYADHNNWFDPPFIYFAYDLGQDALKRNYDRLPQDLKNTFSRDSLPRDFFVVAQSLPYGSQESGIDGFGLKCHGYMERLNHPFHIHAYVYAYMNTNKMSLSQNHDEVNSHADDEFGNVMSPRNFLIHGINKNPREADIQTLWSYVYGGPHGESAITLHILTNTPPTKGHIDYKKSSFKDFMNLLKNNPNDLVGRNIHQQLADTLAYR